MNASHVKDVNQLIALVFRRDLDFHESYGGNVAGLGKDVVLVDFTTSLDSASTLLDLLNKVLGLAGSECTQETQQDLHVLMVDYQVNVNTDCVDTGNIGIF